jgi:RNA polymerase sigma factor (TIGR02999 family)
VLFFSDFQPGAIVSDGPSKPISALLVRWKSGDPEALQALLPLVYEELRRLAHYYLRGERRRHTLQSTALVHEAYLRLVEKPLQLQNRAHFFAVAARLMREILVDHARSRRAAKRDFRCRITLDQAAALPQRREIDVVALDDALNALTGLDPRQGRIVELRFFGGLSIEETSEAMGISPATVKREWATARAWLHREIKGTTSP